MSVFAFDQTIKEQIRNVIEYANHNIYSIDDVLDMMNRQREVPGSKPEHLVLVTNARWVCYYIVDHPEHGRSHYFHIHPDAPGRLPEMPVVEHIVKEFGIENPILEKHISIDKEHSIVNLILPIKMNRS